MTSCLVTGGAGFIGGHLVEALAERGHRVRVLDDFSSGRHENLLAVRDRAQILAGDVRDPEICRQAVEGIETVFHLAALPSVQRSIEDPASTVAVNEIGTAALLDASARAGVKRFILSSSSSVYGDAPELPKREDQAPRPLSPYAASKLAAEYACRAISGVSRLQTVCLRYFNVFGPRQDPDSPYAAVIPKFIARLAAGQPPIVYGDGAQTRDFTYVDNAVQANILAAERPDLPGDGTPINVATGASVSLNRLVEELSRLLGTSVPPHFHPPRPGDILHSQADVSRARDLLGYAPRVTFEEGLRRTVETSRKR